jgi:hypothetical protein
MVRTVLVVRKRAWQERLPRLEMEVLFGLEDELASEFEGSGVKRVGDLTKVALGSPIGVQSLEAVTDIAELGVVEGVERLEAKLEASSFLNRKGFVE